MHFGVLRLRVEIDFDNILLIVNSINLTHDAIELVEQAYEWLCLAETVHWAVKTRLNVKVVFIGSLLTE
jgi:hypothetical protein